MKNFKTFKIFRYTNDEQLQKFTESTIIYARSPEAASKTAREWALELVGYQVEEIDETTSEPPPQQIVIE